MYSTPTNEELEQKQRFFDRFTLPHIKVLIQRLDKTISVYEKDTSHIRAKQKEYCKSAKMYLENPSQENLERYTQAYNAVQPDLKNEKEKIGYGVFQLFKLGYDTATELELDIGASVKNVSDFCKWNGNHYRSKMQTSNNNNPSIINENLSNNNNTSSNSIEMQGLKK